MASSTTYRPTGPAQFAGRWAASLPAGARVGVDGAVDADTERYARALADALRERARPVLVTAWSAFWRPRSLRFEHGRDDPDAFHDDWLDVAGLHREVLEPLGEPAGRRWVPSLYDPATDRASRARREAVPDDAVLVLAGPFLLREDLRRGLDAVVHLSTSDAAVRRRVPAGDAERVLGAWHRYLAESEPLQRADAVLRCEDPLHPAELVRG
ncbi:nucleoside/nucleotide kinase family protein [Kineococcus indalonis]|uniref:uridine kinase n=1 Tax=Kineococcus indalonis TaxID=2696566 RepID=UPI0014135836|nr:uridine kinase [Kineococcus indalonis]NAZ88478.1 uridine kinase [Kineococcus indalonis]